MARLLIVLVTLVASSTWALAGTLHNAAKKGDVAEVRQLLAEGAKVDEVDTFLGTPLHAAIAGRHPEIVALLIAAGADVNAKELSLGLTPLHLAALSGATNVAVLLLDNRANIEARNNEGSTPLLLAAGHGRLEVVALLIARGADVNTHNDVGDVVAVTLLGFASSAAPALSVETFVYPNDETVAACRNESHKTDPDKAKHACLLLNEMAEESYCHLALSPEQAEEYRKAAAAGDADAQYTLGCVYGWGVGVPVDEAKMWNWWLRAADQGHFRANVQLIRYYRIRHEPIHEYVRIALLLKHAPPNDSDDEDQVEHAAWLLPRLTKLMTPAQLEQAKALVSAWKPTRGQ